MIQQLVHQLAKEAIGVTDSCRALGISRSGYSFELRYSNGGDRLTFRQGRTVKLVPNHEATNNADTPQSAAVGVEEVLQLLEGRWKRIILFHLFCGQIQRYSDLERLVPDVSQKMLAKQQRRLESDGIVKHTVYPRVPPKVEYRLTAWGQSLCPALDALLTWSAKHAELAPDAHNGA